MRCSQVFCAEPDVGGPGFRRGAPNLAGGDAAPRKAAVHRRRPNGEQPVRQDGVPGQFQCRGGPGSGPRAPSGLGVPTRGREGGQVTSAAP